MNRFLRLFLLISVASYSFSANAGDHRHSMTNSVDDQGAYDCSRVRAYFDDEETVRGEQDFTLTAAQVPQLQMDSTVGGIEVRGWDGSDYHFRVCKTAGGATVAEAQQTLQQIRVEVASGKISVHGPGDEGQNWSVYLLVQAPRNANVDLKSTNGPISLRELSGKVTARTTNGPISIKDCSGEVNASAHNGPISLKGSTGDIHAETQNGPISVSLTGTAWQGVGLQAQAQNGPVSLFVPENYQSGVVVQTDGHSSMSCRASACGNARKTWDEGYRRIELGSGAPAVKLSTVNGPASVQSGNSGEM